MMTKCVCACINDGVAEDKNPPAQKLVKEEINTNINTGEGMTGTCRRICLRNLDKRKE